MSSNERRLRDAGWDVVLAETYPWHVQHWSKRNQAWRSEAWKRTLEEAIDDLMETFHFNRGVAKHPPTMRIWNKLTDEIIMGDIL